MSGENPVELFKHNGRKLRRKSCTTSALLANKNLGPRKTSMAEIPTTSSLPPRTVILPPPKPPTLNRRGRPLSAKGRPQATMISSLDQPDGYRIHFALQHSSPLPPIGKPEPPTTPEDKLTEVDSAVDLEYSSTCGEPSNVHVPPHVEISRSHSCYEQYKLEDYDENPAAQQSNVTSTASKQQDTSTLPTVELRLRLLSGKCINAEFPLSATLYKVYKHAQESSSEDLSRCIICSNEIPRREFYDKTVTLREAGVIVRTMLYFIES